MARQTRRGLAQDRRLKAKRPGKRVTAWGSTYTESRVNRSDVKRRKRKRG